jgi:4'-phosphopantetheinyl transferase
VAATAVAQHGLARLRAGDHADVIFGYPQRAGPDALARAHALLDDGERACAAAFAFEHDRVVYTFSHGLLRLTLAGYLDADPRALRFVHSARGRPELASTGDPPLRFNLAHTEGLVACVVTACADCGVDVECFARIDHRDLAPRVLTDAESAALTALPDAERRERLLELWTLKEAYLKARGLGLSAPPREIAFPELGASPRCELGPALEDDGRAWRFWSGAPTPLHRAAAAIRTQGRPARFAIVEAGQV